MRRLVLLCSLFVAASTSAMAATTPPFPFTYYIHDSTGVVADTPLPPLFQFPATPLGSNSHFLIRAFNTSGVTAFVGTVIVTTTDTTTVLNSNFTVTGLAYANSVAAGGSFVFTVNFSPTTTGPITAYLQTSYQVQQNGCSFTSTNPLTQCPSGLNLSATLSGTATQPQLVLSYQTSGGSKTLQPSGTPLSFGSVSASGTLPITFTLSNESTVSINAPSISVPPPTVYSTSPFQVDLSSLPSSLAAGQSANFTITFEPGQTGLATAFLLVGSNSYPIQGEGVIVASVDALQISYVDSTGVRSLPQAASPISFGQTVSGTTTSNVLTFTVTNPIVSFNSVTVQSLSVTGAGFTLFSAITGATAFPASVAPGASITFKVGFAATGAGAYTGNLTIGSRTFSLTGLSVSSPLPTFSLTVNPSPLSSQQQATVAVQLATPSTINLLGTISLTFKPSVTGVTDDPAVMFVAHGTRQLSLTVSSGAQTANYSGQSALAFQTGTTAGTITFSVAFPNTPTFIQSFTITPATMQISSASAVRSSPNLVVTVSGYDNTYTASQFNFTFYDTSGKVIGSPIGVNASGSFQNLFFTNNQSGGAFSLQATFPVTGSVTQIGSVALTMNNSVGQANTTQVFQ